MAAGIMEDHEIEKSILAILSGTAYELLSFERNHEFFGNMIATIKMGKLKFSFVSDRGDIMCNGKLIFASAYHIAGEDDTPKYLIKAIEQFVR